MDLEESLKRAIARAHRAAGVGLKEEHAASLASVYADWAQGAGDGVVERVERAFLALLSRPGSTARW